MMSNEQATLFLQRMSSDLKLRQQVKQEYRQLLCDIARREGLTVSVEDLQLALKEEKCRLNDEVLEAVTGGIYNTSDPWFGEPRVPKNTAGGGFNNF